MKILLPPCHQVSPNSSSIDFLLLFFRNFFSSTMSHYHNFYFGALMTVGSPNDIDKLSPCLNLGTISRTTNGEMGLMTTGVVCLLSQAEKCTTNVRSPNWLLCGTESGSTAFSSTMFLSRKKYDFKVKCTELYLCPFFPPVVMSLYLQIISETDVGPSLCLLLHTLRFLSTWV